MFDLSPAHLCLPVAHGFVHRIDKVFPTCLLLHARKVIVFIGVDGLDGEVGLIRSSFV